MLEVRALIVGTLPKRSGCDIRIVCYILLFMYTCTYVHKCVYIFTERERERENERERQKYMHSLPHLDNKQWERLEGHASSWQQPAS